MSMLRWSALLGARLEHQQSFSSTMAKANLRSVQLPEQRPSDCQFQLTGGGVVSVGR